MSNQTNPAEELELETAELNYYVEMGEALKELRKNKHFQKVILEGYFKDKALSSVSLLGIPQVSEQGKRTGVFEDLIAISNLQYYFQMIENFYEGATNPVLTEEEEMELAENTEKEVH